VTGLAGHTYPIQASADLTNWVTLTNLTLSSPSGQFTDTNAPNFLHRFYRAVDP
jgi:hypothetical protein